MTARDVFGILVRFLGLIFFALGVCYGVVGLVMCIGVWKPSTHEYYPTAVTYLLVGTCIAVFGLYFVRGAPLLMRFAYGNEPADNG
jgi:hypothetical protein